MRPPVVFTLPVNYWWLYEHGLVVRQRRGKTIARFFKFAAYSGAFGYIGHFLINLIHFLNAFTWP